MAQDGAPKRRLGRGLDALLGGKPQQAPEAIPVAIVQPVNAAEVPSQPVTLLAVNQIRRNPFQPRSEFDEDSLNDLAKSIGLHGILQPVLVRKTEKGYQLIAGERRWLAAQRAGLKEVPCRVMELADREVSEAAMEENLKRKDLNVLEKAQAFQDYVDRFGLHDRRVRQTTFDGPIDGFEHASVARASRTGTSTAPRRKNHRRTRQGHTTA